MFKTDQPYDFGGVPVHFVQTFRTRRGTIHRFKYGNGSCFDIGPADISQVREGPVQNSADNDLQIWLRHGRVGKGKTYEQEVERAKRIEADGAR